MSKLKYLKNILNNISTPLDDLCSKAIVLCSIKNKNINNILSYRIKLSLLNDNNVLGETENSLTSEECYNFETNFNLIYYFEKNQPMLIEVINPYSVDRYNTSVASVIGVRQGLSKFETDNYELQIKINQFDDNNNKDVCLELYNSSVNIINQYNMLYYYILSVFDGASYRKVYKSEEVNSNTNFSPLTSDLNTLILGNALGKLKLDFYNENHIPINESLPFEINCSEIKNSNITVILQDNKTININIGITKHMRFLDYLNNGLELNLIVGIDFTASNGNPMKSDSLHSLVNSEPNPYERAIRSCGNIVSYYDSDQRFGVFGFGGIPKGITSVNHFFPLNYNINSPTVGSIDEMISVYKSALEITTLYGPTMFAPLINNICSLSVNNSHIYMVLMIITDGMIIDMPQTIDEIIKASKLPISIIIIGVGNEDFSNMIELDGDDMPLSNGNETVERDIVQFVEFKKFEYSQDKLAEEVLREIPIQVEQYYRFNKKYNNNNNNNNYIFENNKII